MAMLFGDAEVAEAEGQEREQPQVSQEAPPQAAQVAQEEQQAQDAPEQIEEEPTETDWRAVAEEQRKENERLRRNLQAARRGERQNKGRDTSEVHELRQELRSMQRQVASFLPDEQERQQRLEQIAEAERADGTRVVSAVRESVNEQIADLLGEAGLSADDVKPLVQELTPMWRNINGANEGQMFYRLFERELERFKAQKDTAQQPRQEQQEQQQEEQRQNPNRLAMGTTPAGRGGIPRPTLENIDRLFVQWGVEHPGEPNPYTEDYRSVMRTGRLAQR